MLPEIAGDVTTSRTFITPDVFDIKYMMSDGKENEYINKNYKNNLINIDLKKLTENQELFSKKIFEF